MANIFWLPPSQQQLDAWRGKKTLADYPEPVQETWDENMEHLVWFRSRLSQFLYNGFGATGFNYLVAYQDFNDMNIHGQALDEWKWKLTVMEGKALTLMNRPA